MSAPILNIAKISSENLRTILEKCFVKKLAVEGGSHQVASSTEIGPVDQFEVVKAPCDKESDAKQCLSMRYRFRDTKQFNFGITLGLFQGVCIVPGLCIGIQMPMPPSLGISFSIRHDEFYTAGSMMELDEGDTIKDAYIVIPEGSFIEKYMFVVLESGKAVFGYISPEK